jgi:hypothetical protein
VDQGRPDSLCLSPAILTLCLSSWMKKEGEGCWLCVTGLRARSVSEGAAIDGRPQGTVTERGLSPAQEIAGGEPMSGRNARVHRVALGTAKTEFSGSW